MSLTIDTATADASNTGDDTFNHTVDADSGSSILIVAIYHTDSAGAVVGVTYDGVSMTQIAEEERSSGRTLDVYMLNNPSTGTNSVSVDVGAGTNWGAHAFTIKNCNPNLNTITVTKGTSSTSSSSPDSDTVTNYNDTGSHLISIANASGNPTVTAGTELAEDALGSATANIAYIEGTTVTRTYASGEHCRVYFKVFPVGRGPGAFIVSD